MTTLARQLVITLILVGSVIFPGLVSAQSPFFVDRFRGVKLGNHLVDADGEFVLGKGYVHRAGDEGPQSANRHYITTLRYDYISRDWTYDITFFSPYYAPDDILFIGLGEAVPDPEYFNEPRNSINFRIHQGQFAFGTGWRVDIAAHTAGAGVFTYFNLGVGYLPPTWPHGGRFTVRIRKSGNEMMFQVLDTPIFVTVPDVHSSAPFLDESNSRIFFGNASGEYLFSDMRVLPASVQTDH